MISAAKGIPLAIHEHLNGLDFLRSGPYWNATGSVDQSVFPLSVKWRNNSSFTIFPSPLLSLGSTNRSLEIAHEIHRQLLAVSSIGYLLPHVYESLSPKRLAPGKPVMNVRLSVRRCLRILGVEIVFPEIRQRAIYCPCCAHTETDVMKIVALARA